MKSKIIFATLALMFMITSSASACTGKMTSIGNGHNPAVYNNMVVWSDDTSGIGGNIHLYDLNSKKDMALNTSLASFPDIYSNLIVWNDRSQGMPLLEMYDTKTGNGSYISQNLDENSAPKVYGNIIVWSENNAILMADISKATISQIGTGSNPDVYGTKIAYVSGNGMGPGTVYVYDVSTNNSVQCGSGSSVKIYGNKVVISNSDITSGQNTFTVYDLSNGKTTNISSNVGSFDIYGDKIAYVNVTDASGIGGFGISTAGIPTAGVSTAGVSTAGVPCIYTISTGKTTVIPNETQAGNIVIGSSAVVWDTPSGSANITVYPLSSSTSDPAGGTTTKGTKPAAAFKANNVSGKHPYSVTFTYTGTGGKPDSYIWNFGDKTSPVTTTAKNINHTFAKAGTYTVSVTAKNKAGSNTATKSKYITVK